MRQLALLACCWAALLALLTQTHDPALGLVLAGLCMPLASATGIVAAELRYPPAVRTPRMPWRYWYSRGRRAAWRAAGAYRRGDRSYFARAERTLHGRQLTDFFGTYYDLIGPARVRPQPGLSRHLVLGALAKNGGRL